jgi:hypothetical protein
MLRSLKLSAFTTLFLSVHLAVADLTIPFPPTSKTDLSVSTTGSGSISYTTIIESISGPSGTDVFVATSTFISTTTVTTCPLCLSLSTLVTLTQSSTTSPPLLPTTTTSSTPSLPTTTSTGGGGTPSDDIPYADPNNFSPYLPCVPGTFLCTDASTFWTCDITITWSWTWQYPRQVADGMQCIPTLTSGEGESQMPGAPAGYYRNDQYGRARPLGGCEPEGSIECLGDGSTWAICYHEGWVNMGPVAPGTRCVGGTFVLA